MEKYLLADSLINLFIKDNTYGIINKNLKDNGLMGKKLKEHIFYKLGN